MTPINRLVGNGGATVSGLFRLVSVKRFSDTERGDRARVTVADATGFAICDMPISHESFICLTDVRTRFVQIEGRIRRTPGDMVYIDTQRIDKVVTLDRPSWHLLSRTWVPPEAVSAFDRLIALLDRLKGHHVRSLAHRLFISHSIAEPFLCVPASRSHHHAGTGGLLIHSVECAEMAESLSQYVLPTHERELAVMGALLHDLAKIRIMKSRHTGGHAIYGVTQEALNLEVLAPFLVRLDRDWPEGGAGLREILAPAPTYRSSSASPLLVTDLVRYIDRLSSGADIRTQRFRGAPAWRHCVRTEQGALVKRILPASGATQSIEVAP